MNDLNTNKGKKLIIGVSILFCAIILIIGTTLAFFTQSDTKEIGNIVTTNINGTLLFDDNNDYMFGNFIPVNEEDVIKFASKTTDKCKYQDDMYACNMYEFTITNDSNVVQELMITLNPTKNEFGNLYYMLLESNKDNISLDDVPVNKEQINGTNSNIMANKLILGPEESKTYTIVYYIKNLKDIDQTSMDSGKQFYANVRVDSITTGIYAGTLMESRCYEYEEITEGEYAGTYKLTKFNGIDENGLVDNTCGVTEENGFYSVTIPFKLKEEEGNEVNISTLGNMLFAVAIKDESQNIIGLNNYVNIDKIDITEGIKVIEDGGDVNNQVGTFFGIGADLSTGGPDKNRNLEVNLPNGLKHIGDAAFVATALKSIKIPSTVEYIGSESFALDDYLTFVVLEGALEGTSQLKTIGDSAFIGCNITTNKNNPLIIPYSVNYIGYRAFSSIYHLTKLTFAGSHTDVYDDENDPNYNLLTIGGDAFYGDGLDYSDSDELVLPARVSLIGHSAFQGNNNDPIRESLKNIRYMGSRERLNNLGTSWYHTDIVNVKAYGEE